MKTLRLTLPLALITVCLALPSAGALADSKDPVTTLKKADTNGDGTITWEEVVILRKSQFAKLDRNQDGFASAEDRPSGFRGRRYETALKEVTERFDTNDDDRISYAEFVEAPAPVFEAGDTDDNKSLSPDEITALRAMQPKTDAE